MPQSAAGDGQNKLNGLTLNVTRRVGVSTGHGRIPTASDFHGEKPTSRTVDFRDVGHGKLAMIVVRSPWADMDDVVTAVSS